MLVFVDESGDAGMKLGSGSSAFFVVGLAIFRDHAEAEACDKAISDLRKRLSLPAGFEFHYSENTVRQQRAFLEEIARFDYECHVFALNKARLANAGLSVKENIYNWTARTTFEHAREFLDESTIVIDGSGNREFRQQFQTYLKKQVNGPAGKSHIQKVKVQPSHQNNLLQVADYVASLAGGELNGRRGATSLRREFLAARYRTFRVWPT